MGFPVFGNRVRHPFWGSRNRVWFSVSGTWCGFHSRKPIVTYLKMKEELRLNIPMGSEMHRNKLSSGFRSQGTEPSGNGNPDIPSCTWIISLDSEQLLKCMNCATSCHVDLTSNLDYLVIHRLIQYSISCIKWIRSSCDLVADIL
jgi:hypothetical protein